MCVAVLKATSSPVNDAFAVQEEEANCNLCCVEPAEGLSGREGAHCESACGREPARARVVSSSGKTGKGFFFSSDGWVMKGEETQQMKGGVMMRENGNERWRKNWF